MQDVTTVHNTTKDQLIETFFKGLDDRLKELKQGFTPKQPDEFITAKELEKQLKISSTTRWEWGKKGILKPRKIANRTYYLASDIKELLINSK